MRPCVRGDGGEDVSGTEGQRRLEPAGAGRRAWELFCSTLAISMTTNTGYAILAALRRDVCERHRWLGEDEMADAVGLAQGAPGPIAVNASMVVGWQVAGPVGALGAVLGCVLPPFLAMAAVSVAYDSLGANALVAAFLSGMRLGVVALLIDVIAGLVTGLSKHGRAWPWLVVAASFAYVRLTDCSIGWLALTCAAAGAVRALLLRRSLSGGDGA